jgi:hypothetical protein
MKQYFIFLLVLLSFKSQAETAPCNGNLKAQFSANYLNVDYSYAEAGNVEHMTFNLKNIADFVPNESCPLDIALAKKAQIYLPTIDIQIQENGFISGVLVYNKKFDSFSIEEKVASFRVFPAINNIELMKTDGHWKNGDGFYNTRLFTAQKTMTGYSKSGDSLVCDFKFETLLPDVQNVVLPYKKSWADVSWSEKSVNEKLKGTDQFEITYATNLLFSTLSNLPVNWDGTVRNVINPRCLQGHWNLGDKCNPAIDVNEDICQFICDKYANEPTSYTVSRYIIAHGVNKSTSDGTTPPVNLFCTLTTLNKDIYRLDNAEILNVLNH